MATEDQLTALAILTALAVVVLDDLAAGRIDVDQARRIGADLARRRAALGIVRPEGLPGRVA